jgi:hypothetical protein
MLMCLTIIIFSFAGRVYGQASIDDIFAILSILNTNVGNISSRGEQIANILTSIDSVLSIFDSLDQDFWDVLPDIKDELVDGFTSLHTEFTIVNSHLETLTNLVDVVENVENIENILTALSPSITGFFAEVSQKLDIFEDQNFEVYDQLYSLNVTLSEVLYHIGYMHNDFVSLLYITSDILEGLDDIKTFLSSNQDVTTEILERIIDAVLLIDVSCGVNIDFLELHFGNIDSKLDYQRDQLWSIIQSLNDINSMLHNIRSILENIDNYIVWIFDEMQDWREDWLIMAELQTDFYELMSTNIIEINLTTTNIYSESTAFFSQILEMLRDEAFQDISVKEFNAESDLDVEPVKPDNLDSNDVIDIDSPGVSIFDVDPNYEKEKEEAADKKIKKAKEELESAFDALELDSDSFGSVFEVEVDIADYNFHYMVDFGSDDFAEIRNGSRAFFGNLWKFFGFLVLFAYFQSVLRHFSRVSKSSEADLD